MDLTFINYLSLISLVVTLFFALYIFSSNPRAEINKTFGFFLVLVGFWVFTNFMVDIADSSARALFWSRLTIVGPILLAPILLYFSEIFPKVRKSRSAWVYLLLLLPGILMVLLTPTPANVVSVDFVPGKIPEVEVGFLYTLLLIYYSVYLPWTFYNFFRSYRELEGAYKAQVKYVSIGLGMTLIFALTTNLVLVILGNSLLSSFGTASTLIFMSLVSYTIVKHRLMDIRLAVRAVLVRLVVAVMIAVPAYLVSVLYTRNYIETSSTNLGATVIVAALIVVALYESLNRFVRRVTDFALFQREYNRQELLRSLGKSMSESINIRELQNIIKDTLRESIRVKSVDFKLKDHNKGVLWEQLGSNPEMLVYDELIRDVEDIKDESAKEKTSKVLDKMRATGASVILPLPASEGVIGMILLGDKAGGDAFTSSDLNALETLMYQAGIAIENASLYAEAQEFAKKLQVEVKQATEQLKVKNIELKRTNKRLQELDMMKDELVSVASHELRTPLTVIKSYLWTVLDKVQRGVEQPNLEKYIDRAYISSERMIDLVNDMLSASRLEGHRIELKLQPMDVRRIINDVVTGLRTKADEKGIDLEVREPEGEFPKALVDEGRFVEILVNLVGNAVKYTEKGSIEVSVALENHKLDSKADITNGESADEKGRYIWISVKDTGHGISKEDLPRLFKKFGRLDPGSFTKTAEAGGTGLGLYITKGLVELHGGSIWVESKEGKAPVPSGTGQGSEFTFSVRVGD